MCVCVCVCVYRCAHTHTHTLSTEELTIVNHSVANIPHNLNSELSSLVSYKHNYEHIQLKQIKLNYLVKW